MNNRDQYTPGPANAVLEKNAEAWTIVLVRQLRHPPALVWQALTGPEHLRQWSPFDADRSLASAGATVKLTTYGAPTPHVTETTIKRAEAPTLLEYTWGNNAMRWQLEPSEGGTRLTLWTSIDRRFVAMGAAGWHIALDVLDHLIAGQPLGRIAGPEAMQFAPWQRLTAEYATLFGVELPSWLANSAKP